MRVGLGQGLDEMILGGEVLSPEQKPGLMYSKEGRPGGDTLVISGLQALTLAPLSRASFCPTPFH